MGGCKQHIKHIFFLSTAASWGIFVLKISCKKKNGQVLNKPQIRLAVAKNSWRYLFANPDKTLVRVASVSNRVIAQEGAATANLKWNGEGEGRRGHACPQTP